MTRDVVFHFLIHLGMLIAIFFIILSHQAQIRINRETIKFMQATNERLKRIERARQP